MGGRAGYEHHACFSARPPLAAGCARFSAPDRCVSTNRRQTSYPPHVCLVRFLLGVDTEAGAAASADSRGTQLGMGAEPGGTCAARLFAVPKTESVCGGRGGCVCE